MSADETATTPNSMDESSEGEGARPASADLPGRPVLRSLARWVDIQWPAASAQEIVAKGGAYNPGQMIKVGWKLILVTFFMNIWGKIDGDVISPYLNSRVYCCGGAFDAPVLTEHYDITDNATLLYFADNFDAVDKSGEPLAKIKACDVPQIVDTSDVHWSLSGNCVSKSFVLDQTQLIRGWAYQVGSYCAILILPLGGHVGDCWGRKKVYWWTTVCLISVASLYWLDCFVPGGSTHGNAKQSSFEIE